MDILSLTRNTYKKIRQLFIKGLLFLLPIAITFSLFSFSINLIRSWLIPLRRLHLPLLEMIPYYELVVVAIFILAVATIFIAFVILAIDPTDLILI